MARYRARANLNVGAALVRAGEEFDSTDVPGAAWFPLDDDARAAHRARFGSDAPTEFSRHHWRTDKGLTKRGQEADPRETGSFTSADNITRY